MLSLFGGKEIKRCESDFKSLWFGGGVFGKKRGVFCTVAHNTNVHFSVELRVHCKIPKLVYRNQDPPHSHQKQKSLQICTFNIIFLEILDVNPKANNYTYMYVHDRCANQYSNAAPRALQSAKKKGGGFLEDTFHTHPCIIGVDFESSIIVHFHAFNRRAQEGGGHATTVQCKKKKIKKKFKMKLAR